MSNNNDITIEKEQERIKIRKRYATQHNYDTEIIPAKYKMPTIYDDEPRRVAVYARVSTNSIQQTSSYELQKNYYEELIIKHPNWTLVGIYPDEGISGTSLKHRDAFNQMIVDCKSGKIDMIVTKSVSRFARNIVDCITVVRELSKLKPPVGVFFEKESIFTLSLRGIKSLHFYQENK